MSLTAIVGSTLVVFSVIMLIGLSLLGDRVKASFRDISANVLPGGFGVEVGLLSDAAERIHSFILAAADSLLAQAVLYLSAQEPLIGEELFASGAYFNAGRAHLASLYTKDVLRWLIAMALIGGAAMKLVEGML